MNNQKIRAALVVATFAFASAAFAQTMYRCGSVYQDHPCAGAQPEGKVVRNYGGAGAVSTTSDAECKDRGARTLKIVWAREAGASAERQMADARNNDDRKLITEVYAKRGSAPEVRAAIETDCVADKEKAAQLTALLKAQGLAPATSSQAAPPQGTQPSEADSSAADARRRQQLAAREALSKKQDCDNLKSRRENVLSEQRSGGSISRMEDLNRRRESVDNEMRKAGC
jgi:hypothetical protein